MISKVIEQAVAPNAFVFSFISLLFTIFLKVLYHVSLRRLESIYRKTFSGFWKTNNAILLISTIGLLYSIIKSYNTDIHQSARLLIYTASVFAPILMVSGILYDWLVDSSNSLYLFTDKLEDKILSLGKLPHNYLLSTLGESREDDEYLGRSFGVQIDSMREALGILEGFESPDKSTALKYLTFLQFSTIPTKLLDEEGVVTGAERFRCLDLTLNIEGYISFLEGFYKTFSGHKEICDPCRIRLISPFQPYEWFHNPAVGRGKSLKKRVRGLMEVSYKSLNGYSNFRRYIPSNSQMVDHQDSLFIVQVNSSWSPAFEPFKYSQIQGKPLHYSRYPFLEQEEVVEIDESDLFYWVVNEDMIQEFDCLETFNLMDYFCFGETHIINDSNFLRIDSAQKTVPENRINDLEVGALIYDHYNPVRSKSSKYSTSEFDEIVWVGGSVSSDRSILGVGIDFLGDGYVNICVFPDVRDSIHFKGLFDRLDTAISNSEIRESYSIGTSCS